MDPTTRQEAAYKAKAFMQAVTDKAKITAAKVKGEVSRSASQTLANLVLLPAQPHIIHHPITPACLS